MALKLVSVFSMMILGMWASQVSCRVGPEPLSMVERHEQWMAQYGREYSSNEERMMRFNIFNDNVKFIDAFNAAGTRSYKLGVNAFADQTNQEFSMARNGLKFSSPLQTKITSFRYENVTAIPSTMDWRKKGAVTPIKDQGQCGNMKFTHDIQNFQHKFRLINRT